MTTPPITPITTSASSTSTYSDSDAPIPIEPTSLEARTVRAASPTFDAMLSLLSGMHTMSSDVSYQTEASTDEPTEPLSPTTGSQELSEMVSEFSRMRIMLPNTINDTASTDEPEEPSSPGASPIHSPRSGNPLLYVISLFPDMTQSKMYESTESSSTTRMLLNISTSLNPSSDSEMESVSGNTVRREGSPTDEPIETGSPTPSDTAEAEEWTAKEHVEFFVQNALFASYEEFPNKEEFEKTIAALWDIKKDKQPIVFIQSIGPNTYYFKMNETEKGLNLSILKHFKEEARTLADDLVFSTFEQIKGKLGLLLEGVNDSDDFHFMIKITQTFSDETNSPPAEELVQNSDDLIDVQSFVKNAEVSDFEKFPSKKEFKETLKSLWITRDKKNVVLSFEIDSEKYYFKFVLDTRNDEETVDCGILRATGDTASLLRSADYMHFASIEEVTKHFAPLFAEKYESADAFNDQLQPLIVQAVKKYFIGETDYTLLDGSLDQNEFSLELENLWKAREENTGITMGFKKSSSEYLFRFETNEEGEVDFDCMRVLDGITEIEPENDSITFKDIEDAIASLSPVFEEGEESETVFFEQLKQMIASQQSKSSSPTLPEPSLKDTDKILSPMEYERQLDQMQSKVSSEDPAVLKDAFDTLQEMNFSSLLEIGDDIQFMPIKGLVLYYLNIIQLNETPEVLKDAPLYAANAFQNIDGCSSSANQRSRALLYTQADMLFYALESALIEGDNITAQSLVQRIQEVGAQMPSYIKMRMMQFKLDFTQGSNEQFDSLFQTKAAMKEALDLP
jgi:hypothetical protein